MLKRILAGLVVALTLIGAAVAGPFEDGLAAYERGDYGTALRQWRTLAEQGHADAQYNLGFMYDNGRGAPEDNAEAVKWYQLAADQGFADAQNNLAVMYGIGQGVSQDYAEAAKWYRLAAEQGHANAQNSLGIRYATGQGVSQDMFRAFMWFALAGAQGDVDAVRNRDIAASLMTPEQIADARRLAREWLAAH